MQRYLLSRFARARLITFAFFDLTVSAERLQLAKALAFCRQNRIDLPFGALTEDGGRWSEGRK